MPPSTHHPSQSRSQPSPPARVERATISRALDASAAWAIALVALALAARVFAAWRAPIIESDGAYYSSLAGRLLAGDPRWLSAAWPPLLPVLTAAVAAPGVWLGAHPSPELLERAARAVSILAGCALLLPLYRLARRVLDPRGAAIATTLAAAHPRLIVYSAAALTESAYTACLVAAAAAAAAAQPALAGIALGLATLARPEAALLALVAAIAGLVTRAVPRAALLRAAAGFALIAVPYVLATSLQTGRPTLGEKPGYNLWRIHKQEYARHFPPPSKLERVVNESPELTAGLVPEPVRVLGLLAAEPGAMIGGTLRRLARLLLSSLPWVLTPPIVLLALLGVASVGPRAWRPPRGARGWIALPIVALPLVIAPAGDDRRFVIPLIPFALLFAAAGWRRLERDPPPASVAWGFAPRAGNLLLAATVAAGIAGAIVSGPIDEAPEHREAGLWLRQHALGSGAIIRSRKPWVAYYAGGLVSTLPEGGLEELRRAVATEGGDILVMDERWGRPHRPALAAWLDTAGTGAPPILDRVTAPRGLTLYDLRAWGDGERGDSAHARRRIEGLGP